MIHLIYGSVATNPMSDEELWGILHKARENNTRLSITGMLLYRNSNFLQVLEGPEEAVESLFETIKKDPRHEHIMRITKRQVEERHFPDWKMGFVDINQLTAKENAGFSDFLMKQDAFDQMAEKPSLAYTFLNTFRDHVR